VFGHPNREERSAYLTADQYYAGYTAGIGECIMLNDLPAGQQVYLITGYTDLRRSIDGLASIIQGQLNLDPFSTALFLFCGRRRDRIKGLLWESDGFLLLYKRLDNGCFQWPRSEMEAKLLTPQQIRWLLEGLKIEQPKAIREGKPGALY
jgi:transposase